MAKVKHLFSLLLLLTLFGTARAQGYKVLYKGVDAESAILKEKLALKDSFASRTEANMYVAGLPSLMQSRGFITAAVDSLQFDSSEAFITIYLGEQYKWARISTSAEWAEMLQTAQWPSAALNGSAIDFKTLEENQKKLLDHFEEQGYPFAKIYLDSISINGPEVSALMKIIRGPQYKIDSIRVYGDAKVSNDFLQRYLQITNGSVYNKRKLENVSKKIAELSYVQEERPSDLTLLGTGSVLNLYLKSRKSSQVNALVGFLPNSNQLEGKKLLLTVDANILLRNALGNGETLGLVWQQLQQKSPRLNLFFEQPYIFKSPFGLNFNFDMFRKDSTFLNINMTLGTVYRIEERKTVTIFLQRRSTIATPNTALILQTRQLPQEIDVSSLNLGVTYQYNATDYRFNPRKGFEASVTTAAGNKKIKKNNAVLELKDPSNPSFKFEKLYDTVRLKAYQFRFSGSIAKYLPLATQSVFKLGLNAGIYQSANYFRNELFQIGGYKLMRGFDEESQYVSQYGIGTVEYRYLLGQNSAFFAFVDGGWGKHQLEVKKSHTYIGTGAGLSFETKAGIFNLTWAIGKRDDNDLNLRNSKLHFGFVNYF
jgi:outer membrane protein assembly factor BamA